MIVVESLTVVILTAFARLRFKWSIRTLPFWTVSAAACLESQLFCMLLNNGSMAAKTVAIIAIAITISSRVRAVEARILFFGYCIFLPSLTYEPLHFGRLVFNTQMFYLNQPMASLMALGGNSRFIFLLIFASSILDSWL
ncbi:hypothetical protein ES703_46994 [subsurface metagenome]